MANKIGWNDLSLGAKVGIVGGWVVLIIYVISFTVGFVIGLLG